MPSSKNGSPTDRARLEVANALRNGAGLTSREVRDIASEQGLGEHSAKQFPTAITYTNFQHATGVKTARVSNIVGQKNRGHVYVDSGLDQDDRRNAIENAKKRERE